MREGQPTAIHRAAYAAPAFWIDTVDLTFDLDPAKTRVLNKMRLRRNPDVAAQPLRLDGEDLNLASWQACIHRARAAGLHLAINRDDAFEAQSLQYR